MTTKLKTKVKQPQTITVTFDAKESFAPVAEQIIKQYFSGSLYSESCCEELAKIALVVKPLLAEKDKITWTFPANLHDSIMDGVNAAIKELDFEYENTYEEALAFITLAKLLNSKKPMPKSVSLWGE